MKSTQAPSNQALTGPKYSEGDRGTSSNPRRADDGRLMYNEHMVQPVTGYRGPLCKIPFPEVRAGLREALLCTGVASWEEVPLPPAGLPGKLHEQYDDGEDAFKLLVLGIDYVKAIAFNNRRTMHNRWQEARDFILAIERRAIEAHVAGEIRQACDESQAFADSQMVYFIASESGPVKIGIAVNPVKRLKGLQTGHHEKLSILATCPGGVGQERAYHRRFADHRLNGEWFERHPDILAEIARINQESTQ